MKVQLSPDDKIFEKETRIQVATVQSMVKRILYILDKEISADEEIIFANQQDYQNKYRSVVEYFDAVRIALTSTPALHTTQIFGAPIFKYSYREAVIDGYLVDQRPAYFENKVERRRHSLQAGRYHCNLQSCNRRNYQ